MIAERVSGSASYFWWPILFHLIILDLIQQP